MLDPIDVSVAKAVGKPRACGILDPPPIRLMKFQQEERTLGLGRVRLDFVQQPLIISQSTTV